MPSAFVAVNSGINTIIALVSISINALIIFAFVKVKSLRTENNTFLIQLAAADMIKSVLVILVKVHNQFNDKTSLPPFYCQFSGVVVTVTTLMAVLLLAAIAGVRYYKIVRWKTCEQVFSPRRMKLYSAGIIFVAFLPAILPLSGVGKFTYSIFHGVCFATWHKRNWPFRFIFYIYTIGFAYPVMIFCYSAIYLKLRSQNAKMGKNRMFTWKKKKEEEARLGHDNNELNNGSSQKELCNTTENNVELKSEHSTVHDGEDYTAEMKFLQESKPDAFEKNQSNEVQVLPDKAVSERRDKQEHKFSKREVQITKVMFTVVIAYAVCWLPAFLITVVTLSGFAKPSPDAFHVIVTCVEMKLLLNPLIYGIWNPQFRKQIKKLLFKKFSTEASSANEAYSHTSNSNTSHV